MDFVMQVTAVVRAGRCLNDEMVKVSAIEPFGSAVCSFEVPMDQQPRIGQQFKMVVEWR